MSVKRFFDGKKNKWGPRLPPSLLRSFGATGRGGDGFSVETQQTIRHARVGGHPISFLVLAAFFLLLVFPVHAQDAKDLAKVEKKLSESKESVAKLAEKEQAASQELEALRGKLVGATESLQGKESEQKKIEARLASLEKDVVLREAVLGRSRVRLAQLTSALVQLARRPPALFLMLERSEDDHIHRSILLRSMLPKLRDETASLVREIESYNQLRQQASQQKMVVAAARQNLEWQRHGLDQMIRSRQGLLQKTVAEKQAIAKQLEALTSEAKDLRQLMEKVSNPSWGKTVGRATGSVRLREGLKMPVVGEVVRGYGMKDEFGVASEGVTLRGAPGGIVVAPQGGKVVFTGPFRGYGQIVILQHPKGHHSFMAGFGRIDADMGQTVDAGEPLGVLLAQSEPQLYFEWRKGNSPIDPTSGLGKR